MSLVLTRCPYLNFFQYFSLLALIFLGLTNTAFAALTLNEVDVDTDGVDKAEFVELYDSSGTSVSLDGYVLAFINGSNEEIYGQVDLTGFMTNSNGYFVVCREALNVANCDLDLSGTSNMLQNGSDAVALYLGAIDDYASGTYLTYSGLVDAIVYGTSDGDDAELLTLLTEPAIQVDENINGDAPQVSMQWCANGTKPALGSTGYITARPTPGVSNDCPQLAAQFKVELMLQGAYAEHLDTMRTDLFDQGLLPSLQPYGASIHQYQGSEALNASIDWEQIGAKPVDWVLLSWLGLDGEILERQAAILLANGKVVESGTGAELLQTTLSSGNYAIHVSHRNHLSLQTNNAISLQSGAISHIDFTAEDTGVNGAFARVRIGDVLAMRAGDLNHDNTIIAAGVNSDIHQLDTAVLNQPSNVQANTNFSIRGYFIEDANLDGILINTGPENDRNFVWSNVLMHENNSLLDVSFIGRSH